MLLPLGALGCFEHSTHGVWRARVRALLRGMDKNKHKTCLAVR
jgi:hypothetical protein